MKFNGVITRHNRIDWGGYYRDTHHNPDILVYPSDYVKGTYLVAEIHGRFGDDFCPGQHPETISENKDSPEIVVEMEISKTLIGRLIEDGETRPENIAKLRELINQKISPSYEN